MCAHRCRYLDELQALAVSLGPPARRTRIFTRCCWIAERLRDARQERLFAAETTIPGIVWFVVIVGGAITIAFSSFLGAPNVLMHLSMCCLLAVSGVGARFDYCPEQSVSSHFRVSTAPFDYVLSRIGEAPSRSPNEGRAGANMLAFLTFDLDERVGAVCATIPPHRAILPTFCRTVSPWKESSPNWYCGSLHHRLRCRTPGVEMFVVPREAGGPGLRP